MSNCIIFTPLSPFLNNERIWGRAIDAWRLVRLRTNFQLENPKIVRDGRTLSQFSIEMMRGGAPEGTPPLTEAILT